MPPQEKISSISDEVPSRPTISVPKKVNTGTMLLRSTMPRMRRSPRPLERAKRMNSLSTISEAIARVCFMIGAQATTATVITGSSKCDNAERATSHWPLSSASMK